MSDKSASQSDAGEAALEKKVDAMLDPKAPDPAPAAGAGSAKTTPPGPPPLDIFSGNPPAEAAPAAETVTTAPAEASAPSPPAAEAAPAASEPSLDDDGTDAAVDAIAAHDGDELLEAEDAKRQPAAAGPPKHPFRRKLSRLLHSRKAWLIVLVVIVALAAVPWTRYHLAGLVVHKNVRITVVDSKTGTPVSRATVKLAGRSGETNAAGKVDLTVPVGASRLVISKQYYRTTAQAVTVGFHGPAPLRLKLAATGRQVPLSVVNKINGRPIAGVTISVLKTKVTTDAKGRATIVLPANASTDTASLSAKGYAATTAKITVTSKDVAANRLALVPAGHVYFLSNLSGRIDVVSTNLDGTDRQTVLAGTGHEDPSDTSLLASRDWHYLVLEARRNDNRPALYLINTATGKSVEFDNSNASFTLIGWYGHNFVYDIQSNSVPVSQPGHELIKSYNADNQQLNQLDGSLEQGTADSYAYQSFSNFYLVDGGLVYTVQWYTYDATGLGYDLSNTNDFIRGVGAGGQDKRDYQTFAADSSGYIQTALAGPNDIYYGIYDYQDNKTLYYEYDDGTVSANNELSQSSFQRSYPTYLVSPGGKLTFWTDLRDGNNALFVGDQNGHGSHELKTDGSYKPYGWFTDSYVLVSKNSSQLYILPAAGLKADQSPLKITDYYKPDVSYQGYGYGYGGL